MATVAVTGATGVIGRRLVRALLARGDRVVALLRSTGRDLPAGVEQRRWDVSDERAPLQGAEAVVHLAGAPVAVRWTASNKRLIRESRVAGTRSVVRGLEGARVLVSASGIDLHGDTGEAEVTESTGAGSGFLAQTAVLWEAEALRAREKGARVVLLRTGLLLAPEGEALGRMVLATKLLAGGPMGSGEQFTPWIHPDDEIGLFLHAVDSGSVSGPMIAAAPNPVRQRELARAIGEVLHRPAITPAPAAALKLLFGEMSEIVLASHRVRPEVALRTGYRFRFPELAPALRDLIG
jgi:uncharacterized protein (TIGR01777 family)